MAMLFLAQVLEECLPWPRSVGKIPMMVICQMPLGKIPMPLGKVPMMALHMTMMRLMLMGNIWDGAPTGL